MGLKIEGIDEAIKELEEVSMGALVGAALEAGSKLKQPGRTPRDTGFAANSWLVTNSPDDAGTPGGNAVDGKLSVLNKIKMGETIYINNGCEYIRRLEEGHSQQAPNGFVAVTVREIPDMIKKQVKDEQRSRGE